MLDFDRVEWDDANVDHIEDNGLGVDEVEDVLYDPASVQTRSRSSGRPAAIGDTATGKTIIVIYETRKEGNTVVLRPVTAYEIGD